MSVALARPTVALKSFLTSGWGSSVPTATLATISTLPRSHSRPADAHETPRAPRGGATSPVSHAPDAPQSRAPEPMVAIQIP